MAKDSFTLPLAERLAHKIRLYWKKRGYLVNTRVERIPTPPEVTEDLYQVRSDMVAGLPKDFGQPVLALAA
jgi:hypothetical protein